MPEHRVELVSPWRSGLAVAVGVAAIVYVFSIIAGLVPESRRIDGTGLVVLVLATICAILLVRPRAFERLGLLEVGGFKLQLNKIETLQKDQERRLSDISSLLPLILPQPERRHMLNLSTGRTKDYTANGTLRRELRRLRSIQIIESKPNIPIGHMRDGMKFDLAQYVQLTKHGEEWVRVVQDEGNAETEG